jgi:hypothetical protein
MKAIFFNPDLQTKNNDSFDEEAKIGARFEGARMKS